MTTITTGTNHGSIALTTVPNTVEIGETWTINESAIMYIRPKTITFTAQGLKPNTRYYPFFNNVDISDYCSIENGQTSSIIISNSIGSIVGNFYLPAATFTCGSHNFKLVDNVKVINSSQNNKTVNLPDPLYGSAEAFYEASGLLKQQQKLITTLTVIDAPPPPPGVLPVYPPPIITLPPIPSIPYPPPQIPEPILPKFVANPPIPAPQSPSTMGCWIYYFEYNVTHNAVQPNYTVPSQNPIPPTVDKILAMGSGIINSNAITSVKFVKSDKISENQWNHVFSIDAPITKKYKITINNSRRSIPSTETFNVSRRPSGLPESAIYSPIIPKGGTSPWIYEGESTAASCRQTQVSSGPAFPIDPLAQSFLVDSNVYPLGVFATSISVYFKRVDQSCPVILELREMINGFPGANILPGGKVILPGTTVSQSDNATIPTVFSFDQPIYLSKGVEYCFVVKSSSLGYDIWCSRFGDIDVVSGKVIDEQPVVGVLFKSANDSTWTPTQYEDIKYDLNIAEFDNNLLSVVNLQPQKSVLAGPISLYYDTKQNLPLSYISTIENSKNVTIYSTMHGLITGDLIYIGDFPDLSSSDINGLLVADLKDKQFTVNVVDEDNVTITLANSANKTGSILIGDSIQTINTNVIDNVFNVNYSASIPYINTNNNSLSVLPKTSTVLTTPTPPTGTSVTTFEFYTNILINEMMIDYLGTELPGTAVVENINTVSGNSSALSFDQYNNVKEYEVENNNKFISFDTPRLFTSGHNERNISAIDRHKNGLVSLELKSNDKHISPIIDLNGMSLIVKTYKIDNQGGEIDYILASNNTSNDLRDSLNDKTLNSEIASGTGIANAKYKTKVVNLNNSTINKRISVFVVGNCPAPAVMDVYVRLSNDASTHIDRDWIWMPLDNARANDLDYRVRFVNSINTNAMTEWYFEYNSSDSFTVFDIKVVMRSTNNSIIPKIYGIRAITNVV